MQARRALLGSQSEVVLYVYMSVRYGSTIEIYGFTRSLRTSLARATRESVVMPSQWRSRSRTQKEDDARTSPGVWKTVNCSTKG